MHNSIEIYTSSGVPLRRGDEPGACPNIYQAVRLKFVKVLYLSLEDASSTYLLGEVIFRRGLGVAIASTTLVAPPHSLNNEVDIFVWYIEIGQLL
jgi:hypothetical protein